MPWVNDTFTIYRYNDNTLIFDSINTTLLHTFKDINLINDSTYCYKIRSNGKYFSSGLIDPIINFSQETCGVPRDTVAPCAPDALILNDCETLPSQAWQTENFQNRLQWNKNNVCAADVAFFSIYFQSPDANSYSLIEQTTDTFYIHQLVNTLAGCYYVSATDSAGNESYKNDTICIENCAYYVLPNVFTPNGDGSNDFFVPFPGWRFVEKIELKIFNRWGNVVFETENPAISWNGNDLSGKPLNDGIYVYNGFYFVKKRDGSLEKKPLPPNKKGGGFVHLIRNE